MIVAPIFIFLFGVTLCADVVKYAAVLFRHGDRTPVDTYPNDPWQNESFWPVPFGELTNIGKKQHYELGKWLRNRYSHLLSTKFDPTEIYVRSTDVDRTLMSAQANLAGLYPPTGNSQWNKDLLWQPIPVHTVPEKDDEVLAMKKKCPEFDKEKERYTNSRAYKERLRTYAGLMEYLSAQACKPVKDYYGILDIYSILYIENLYNFTLPKWTKKVFPRKMAEPAGYSFTENTATPLMAKIKMGPLLKDIVKHMYNAVRKTDVKVSMYSGHDLTVGSYLNALGMFDGKCPPYTATVLTELIYDNETMIYNVQISYRNTTELVEPHILTIPHCGQKCPLREFMNLYSNLLSVNWEIDCHKQVPAPFMGLGFFIGIGVFVLIYVIYNAHLERVSRNVNTLDYTTIRSVETPIKTTATTPE